MKHEIEIPDLPEGWEAVAYREPKAGEYFFSMNRTKYVETDCGNLWLIVRKKQPRRIVLEETDEETNSSSKNTIYVKDTTIDIYSDKLWKIVEDGE